MLDGVESKIDDSPDGPLAVQARELYDKLNQELNDSNTTWCDEKLGTAHLESIYTVVRMISGTPLRDSDHLGSTIINDYGRPYEHGFNNYTGASGYLTSGRYSLYLRGEFQGAPTGVGYSQTLAQELASIDLTVNPVTKIAYGNQATIPLGPIGSVVHFRFLEAYIAANVLNHTISFGKQDEWLGPAQGASMAYSNNAENIYGFHVNRIEPLYIPGLSRITGPFRYEFLVGSLRGHTLMPNPLYAASPGTQPNVINPGNPWVHVEKISFRPTDNVEFGFERTALWGGQGHSPVTLHTFLKSFFSLSAPGPTVKYGPGDPGARFGAFDFSYRLPFLRNWLTLYSDSEVHDDVSPIDAPRRASIRPGIYLSHVPAVPKIDIRIEAAMTDPAVTSSQGGKFMYWETIEKQGYTNQGQLFGDWIGREGKGGQGWITYHLSGNEWLQISLRNQKVAKDFIPGGTTLNEFAFEAVKRIHNHLEVNGRFAVQSSKMPIYFSGQQSVTDTSIRLTWYPDRVVGH
jgi:hypothetical protein